MIFFLINFNVYLSLSFLDYLPIRLAKNIDNPMLTIRIDIPIGEPHPKIASIFIILSLYFCLLKLFIYFSFYGKSYYFID